MGAVLPVTVSSCVMYIHIIIIMVLILIQKLLIVILVRVNWKGIVSILHVLTLNAGCEDFRGSCARGGGECVRYQ